MAVKLRLVRMGKKKQPTYRVVAADSRSPRDGRFIEILGTYAPRGVRPRSPTRWSTIDNAKALKWLRQGAQPTERVEQLLKTSGAWDEFTGGQVEVSGDYEAGDVNTIDGEDVDDEDSELDDDDELDYEDGDVNAQGGRVGGRRHGRATAVDGVDAGGGARPTSPGRSPTSPTRWWSRPSEARLGASLPLHVAPEDMGRVIGRRGRTAQAIRTLVGAAGARDGIAGERRHRRRLRSVARAVPLGHGSRPSSRSAGSASPTGCGRGRGRAVERPSRRLAPGSVARHRQRDRSPWSAPGPTRAATWSDFVGRGWTATGAERLRGPVLRAAPLERPGTPVGARADRRGGGRRPTGASSGRSRRSRPTRPATCSCSTGGGLVPLRFVVRTSRRCGWWSTCPEGLLGLSRVRIDVFTIFPDLVEHLLRRPACSAGAGSEGLARPPGPRPARRRRRPAPLGRRRALRRRRGHGAHAPSRSSRRSRRSTPPRPIVPPLLLLGPGRRAGSTRRSPGSWPARGGSRCCAAATRGSTSGSPTTWSTASCRSATTCSAGGEAAALVVIEAVPALVPGVLGQRRVSAVEESFADGLLEYPQYTRPAEFRGWEVPEVLRSGDHGAVARWRRAEAAPPHARAAPRPDRGPGRAQR